MSSSSKTPTMQDIIAITSAGSQVMAGEGLKREGETRDAPPPNRVRDDADLKLCKLALQVLSNHLKPGEIEAALKDHPELARVFDL